MIARFVQILVLDDILASKSPMSSLPFTRVPLTMVSASVSTASISFPPSTTTRLKCSSESPFGFMVALPLQSLPTAVITGDGVL